MIVQQIVQQKQSPGGVLRNFAKFTGKHLFQGLFFKLGADIVNINDKLKENVKDIGELNQSIQMSQDTNDNKLGEIDSSIKLNKVQ